MFSDEIRQMLYARPFKPFVVDVAEKRMLRVPHTDYALLNPQGTAMTIMDERGVFNHVSVAHITRVVPLETENDAAQTTAKD